jgi:hypothetical protein
MAPANGLENNRRCLTYRAYGEKGIIMEDKIIIDRMDAEEFLEMLMDAANQDDPNQYYSTAQIIENIANEFKTLCEL